MIKANELRIGNWVLNQNKNPVQVERCDFQFIKGFDNIDDCEPIPLTEEILTRCGFMFGKETNINGLIQYDFWQTKNIPNMHRRLLYKDGEYILYISDKMVARAYIKYLHQLQNLYFALTGEELQYNQN